jgi:heme-degrading monooxygenase HmoA
MAFITPDDGYLTLFNLFTTKDVDTQDQVLDAMREIVDGATYPGWVSSTVHAGIEVPGTANYIQWRSLADLEARYQGEAFKQKTVPLFQKLADTVRLIQTEMVYYQRNSALDPITELSPERDDYTVIIHFSTAEENQKELAETLAKRELWMDGLPGYRGHAYFRGLDGTSLINYAQWASKADYDAFHTMPEEERPADVRDGRIRARGLITSRIANTYRVWHTRSAES